MELIFPDGVSASSSLMDGGVRFKPIKFDKNSWDIVELHTGFDEAFARAWFESHQGQGYDILGNIGFILRRGLQTKSKWFCSEAVAAALKVRDPWRLTPNGLHAVLTSFNNNIRSSTGQ